MVSNPLFDVLGKAIPSGMGQMGNMMNIIQQFQQFKNNFHGDPRQQVQQLLNSGKVTQEQYNRAVQLANQLQQMMK